MMGDAVIFILCREAHFLGKVCLAVHKVSLAYLC